MPRTRTRTRTHTRNRLLKTQLLAMATFYEPSKWGKYAALIDNLVDNRFVTGLSLIGVNGTGEVEVKVSYRINWDEHLRLTRETPNLKLPPDWKGEISPDIEEALRRLDLVCEKEGLRPRVQFRVKPGTDLTALGLSRAPNRKWAAGISKRIRATLPELEETEILYESIEFGE